MFAWAVYDFVIKSDDDDQAAEDVQVGLEKGKRAPDFELETLEGGTVKLSDYRGKRVMLNFWASWCGPCRAEMPDMQTFHEDTEIVILAVNLTDTESSEKNIPNFVDEHGLTFPILLDKETEVATRYQIQPIPTSFMIDSDGIIHKVAYGALNYELMVKEFDRMS